MDGSGLMTKNQSPSMSRARRRPTRLPFGPIPMLQARTHSMGTHFGVGRSSRKKISAKARNYTHSWSTTGTATGIRGKIGPAPTADGPIDGKGKVSRAKANWVPSEKIPLDGPEFFHELRRPHRHGLATPYYIPPHRPTIFRRGAQIGAMKGKPISRKANRRRRFSACVPLS